MPQRRRSMTSWRPTASGTGLARAAPRRRAPGRRASAHCRALHRRRPSSRRERGARACRIAIEGGRTADADRFIAVAFPDTEVQILPTTAWSRTWPARRRTPCLRRFVPPASTCRAGTPVPGPAGPGLDVLGGRVVFDYACPRPQRARPAPNRSTSRCCSGASSSPARKSAIRARTSASTSSAASAAPTSSSVSSSSGQAAVAFSHVPGQRGRPHGHRRRGRHHAAEIDMVRAEAAGRAAGALHLSRSDGYFGYDWDVRYEEPAFEPAS